MSAEPVDVAAIRAALGKATPGPWKKHDSKYLGGKYVTGDRPNAPTIIHATETWADPADAELIVLLRNNADALLDALERAQAASEGVDMLVAQAERRGAVKALRAFAEALTEDDAVPWDVYAHEHADAIENGANL